MAAQDTGCKGRIWTIVAICVLSAGCLHVPPAPPDTPTELAKISLPEYRISPPDVLVINALRVVPRPPYHLQTLDLLTIQVSPTLPEQPITGIYAIEPDGNVNLGFNYGTVPVADLTVEDAKKAITQSLKANLKAGFQVSVSLAQSRGLLQIRGEHLIKQDGTIGLGSYGSVPVSGLTVSEAKLVIETHLADYLQKPEVSVEVSGFNSKVYYVITDGGGNGEQVIRIPIMGSETVLDAISQVNGLSPVSSRRLIWIARPTSENAECDQVLPVDWVAITQRGKTATNYQVLPGDRVYIRAEPLVTLDVWLARGISPIERLMGITLLGASTYNGVKTAGGGIGSSTGGTVP